MDLSPTKQVSPLALSGPALTRAPVVPDRYVMHTCSPLKPQYLYVHMLQALALSAAASLRHDNDSTLIVPCLCAPPPRFSCVRVTP